MIRLHIVPAEGESFSRSFEEDSLVIGRSGDSDLALADRFLSRRHARIFRRDEEILVEDLGSRNGTLLNGQRISGASRVRAGDQIRISGSIVRIEEEATAVSSRQEPLKTVGAESIFCSASELLSATAGTPGLHDLDPDGLRRQAARLSLLNDVHKALARSVTLEELLELILDRVVEHLGPEEAVIFLAEEDGNFRRAASRQASLVGDDYLYSQTLVREVSERGLAALVLDAQTDARFAAAESIQISGVRSLVAAPLLYPEGSLGMIMLNSRLAVRQFSEEDMELLTSLASVAALRIWNLTLVEEAVERHKMEQELALARQIQVSLLPKRLPELPGYELIAKNYPSRGVSGDFYQIVERSDGRECVLLIADVSGKGMAAALLTATVEALSAQPIAEGRSAAEIFASLNPLLEERTPSEQFATAFLAVLEPSSGRLTYASAGHNPALLLRVSGEVVELGRTGLPLGLMGSACYEMAEVRLEAGDLLVAYTDGITEATDPSLQQYGVDRLVEVCRAHSADGASSLVTAFEADLEAFSQGEPFADDRTLMVIHRSA